MSLPDQPPTDPRDTPQGGRFGDTVFRHRHSLWGFWVRLLILAFWIAALITVAMSVITHGDNTSQSQSSAGTAASVERSGYRR
jgi:hypothetical protein